ncbi:MAG: hypothetical protein J1E83_14920 [Lachnospiraceae bacterium]|nr:hypothetical protein [Lachnospiraceae bacterium]
MRDLSELLQLNDYHVPQICKECGGVMVFKGVGEYQCEKCKALDYDDYGKVRNYVEVHKGATAAEVEAATNVKQRTIRNMLKEGRLQVSADSKMFLRCEMCGQNIRSGKLCPDCETKYHRKLEDKLRDMHRQNMHGTGMVQEEASGAKRYKRDK